MVEVCTTFGKPLCPDDEIQLARKLNRLANSFFAFLAKLCGFIYF